MPQWLPSTSTHSAYGSRHARQSTIPSLREWIASVGISGSSGSSRSLRKSAQQAPSRQLVDTEAALPRRDHKAALAGAICFALVLLEVARLTSAWPAAIAALLAGGVFLRRRLFAIDFSTTGWKDAAAASPGRTFTSDGTGCVRCALTTPS